MAVKVMTTRLKGGARITETHPEATTFGLSDGHLYVRKSTGGGFSDEVAIYAPGDWLNAVVEKEAKS